MAKEPRPPETKRDTHQWQIEHIRQGLREAEAGRFVQDAEVKRVLARLRR